jgi:hypothetical protein
MKDLVIQALVGLVYFCDELLALLCSRAGGQHCEGLACERAYAVQPLFYFFLGYFFGLKKVGRRRQVPQIQHTFDTKSYYY